jgi:phage terminase large subunit
MAKRSKTTQVADSVENGDLTSLKFFARHVLPHTPYGWQDKVYDDIDVPGSQVAVKTANGTGKTSHIAALAALWHPLAYPDSVTITTSGVFRQVKDQMWPQIRRLASKFRGLGVEPNLTDFTVDHKGGASRVIGFSTDDPGKFEGWHASSILMILDEAKTIPDSIFEAVDRCLQGQPYRVLLLSSPGASSGQFYRAFTSEAHLWKRHTVSAYDCPHIKAEFIEMMIRKWGIDHPHVRSMIFAEFMDLGSDSLVISPDKWDRCLGSKPVKKMGGRTAFCDFAAGGDENCFALREGNRIIDLTSWRETNTMAAVGRFLQLFRQHRLTTGEVFADAGGLGIPMCQRLEEVGFPVNRVNNGSPAYEDERFVNRGGEIWFNAARLIEQCDVELPSDGILRSQATTRRVITDSKGRLGVEQKDSLRRRGCPSPDRADAVLGAIACGMVGDAIMNFARQPTFDLIPSQTSMDEESGFFAGF